MKTDQNKTAEYSTGYVFYKLKSNPNRGDIAVPEEYDRKAGDLVNLTSGIESKRKESKCYESLKAMTEDVLYLTTCYQMSNDEVRLNESEGGKKKQNAINRNGFFKKILESL